MGLLGPQQGWEGDVSLGVVCCGRGVWAHCIILPQPWVSHPPAALGRSSRSISWGPQAPASSVPAAFLAASEPHWAAATKAQAVDKSLSGCGPQAVSC